MIQLCRHILPAGVLCNQSAVKDTLFCRHHSALKTAVAACTPMPDPYGIHKPIRFVFPEDRAAVQLNYFLVLQALNGKSIDNRTANTMNRLLRSCEHNLGQTPLAGESKENTVQRIILTPEGEEIAPPREALEEGESEPFHYKGCPCQKCAEQYRDAQPEQHHAKCQCGLCEAGESVKGKGESGEAADSEALSPLPLPLSPAVKTASTAKLYNKELTRDPANKEFNIIDYMYGDHIKKYEAQYAARAAAAIREGMEPPPYEPFTISKMELEGEKRYKATMEQVEKNKLIGKALMEKRLAEEAAEAERLQQEIDPDFKPFDMKEEARIAFANQPPDINPDLW